MSVVWRTKSDGPITRFIFANGDIVTYNAEDDRLDLQECPEP